MPNDPLVTLYYLFRGFTSGFFFKAFLVFYYQKQGLNFAQIGLLQSVFSGSVILFEVPTGLLADHLGRRKIMGLGALITSIGAGLYWFASSFWMFAVLESLLAFGLTLTSGADAAFIYDYLKSNGKVQSYSIVESKATVAKLIMLSISGIVGGIIASYDLKYLFPVSSLMLFLGFLIARLMRKGLKNKTFKESGPLKQQSPQKEYSLSVGYLWAVAYSTVSFILIRAGDTVIQPVLKDHGVSYIQMGFAVGIGAGASIVGALLLSNRLASKKLRIPIIWGIPIALSLVYVLMSIQTPLIMLGLFALHYLVLGLYSPLTKTLLNEEIAHSSIRATLLSMESAFKRFVLALMMPVIGFFMDAYGISGGVLFCSLIGLLGIALLFVLRFSSQKEESPIS